MLPRLVFVIFASHSMRIRLSSLRELKYDLLFGWKTIFFSFSFKEKLDHTLGSFWEPGKFIRFWSFERALTLTVSYSHLSDHRYNKATCVDTLKAEQIKMRNENEKKEKMRKMSNPSL